MKVISEKLAPASRRIAVVCEKGVRAGGETSLYYQHYLERVLPEEADCHVDFIHFSNQRDIDPVRANAHRLRSHRIITIDSEAMRASALRVAQSPGTPREDVFARNDEIAREMIAPLLREYERVDVFNPGFGVRRAAALIKKYSRTHVDSWGDLEELLYPSKLQDPGAAHWERVRALLDSIYRDWDSIHNYTSIEAGPVNLMAKALDIMAEGGASFNIYVTAGINFLFQYLLDRHPDRARLLAHDASEPGPCIFRAHATDMTAAEVRMAGRALAGRRSDFAPSRRTAIVFDSQTMASTNLTRDDADYYWLVPGAGRRPTFERGWRVVTPLSLYYFIPAYQAVEFARDEVREAYEEHPL